MAAAALKKFPQDQGLRSLKDLADNQAALAAEKEFERSQITAAQQALDGGQTQQAKILVESALKRLPGNPRLESFLATLQGRIAKDLADAERATTLQGANEAVGLGRYTDAIRILERAQSRFPDAPDIEDLLRFVRDQQRKQERQAFIDKIVRDTHRLLDEQQFEKAVQVASTAAGQVPSVD